MTQIVLNLIIQTTYSYTLSVNLNVILNSKFQHEISTKSVMYKLGKCCPSDSAVHGFRAFKHVI